MNQKIIKILLVVFATAFAILVCGLFIPMFLIAAAIVPKLGLAGMIYLFIGGIFGLFFGAITSAASLFRSEELFTVYYIRLVVLLLILSILYALSYLFMSEAYSHV